MTLYTITNPHDPYTLSAPDLATAVAATLLLAEGFYGLRDEIGNTVLPILVMNDADEWHQRTFGCDSRENFKRVGFTAIAECLDTVLPGHIRDRKIYEKSLQSCRLEERATVTQTYIALHPPSSLTDLAKRARELAERIREIAKVAT